MAEQYLGGFVLGTWVHLLPRLPAFWFPFYQHLPPEYWPLSGKQTNLSLVTLGAVILQSTSLLLPHLRSSSWFVVLFCMFLLFIICPNCMCGQSFLSLIAMLYSAAWGDVCPSASPRVKGPGSRLPAPGSEPVSIQRLFLEFLRD